MPLREKAAPQPTASSQPGSQPRSTKGRKARFIVSTTALVIAIHLVLLNVDASAVLEGISELSVLTLGVVLAALLANSLAAALRLRTVAADLGHQISFRQAIAAVSGGSLAGALFYQIAGQLMARGLIMGRNGVPFTSAAVMTVYELLMSATISGLLALAGVYFLFGKVVIDQEAGGTEVITIACGLFGAVAAVALVSHGRMIAILITQVVSRQLLARLLRVAGLCLLVQLPMMVAYVAVAYGLSPQTPIIEIAAASAIVMFAASMPISVAGWGVREMSAMYALGAIGIVASKALVSAIVIGAGSMLAMAAMAVISVPACIGQTQTKISASRSVSYARALAWLLPVAIATLVLFQFYVPLSSTTLLNVNLGDPLAILASLLFAFSAIRQGRWPQWRFEHLNKAVTAATLVLAVSLVVGAIEFGWSSWAAINRFLGWFVLLSFAITGALIVREGGERALRVILLVFTAATAAVVAAEISTVIVEALSSESSRPIAPVEIRGFSQNHNFFAFQILMAISAATVAVRGPALRVGLLTLMFLGLWFCASRAGLVALPFVLGACIYVRASSLGELAIAVMCAAILASALAAPGLLAHGDTQRELAASITPDLMRSPELNSLNNKERLLSIFGGWQLFVDHPIFGAGLGAFRHQEHISTSGQPLLIHSSPIWLLAEMGIVGFLIFAVPVLHILLTEVHRRHRDLSSKLLVICLVAFGIMSVPADMIYQRTFWLLIGAALALRHTSEGRATGAPNQEA